MDQIYEEKLNELEQIQIEIKDKYDQFKDNQRTKIDEFRHLFNSKSNRQISLEQLNQMKTTIEQFEHDITRIRNDECSFESINENLHLQVRNQLAITNNSNRSKLNADAKPFEYSSKLFD